MTDITLTHGAKIRVALLVMLSILSTQHAFAEPATSKKWFPGHYLYADDTSHSKGLNTTKTVLVKNNPYFRGYHVRYMFSSLEPQEGVYDFSKIARDLNIANADGKKLIVHIQDRIFGAVAPTVPTYMTQNPVYEGGFYTNNKGARMPKLWVPAYAARLAALITKLGETFDTHQALAYVTLSETALVDAVNQPGFTSAKLNTSLITIHNAAAEAFPNTIFSQWVNWPGGQTSQDVDVMMVNLVEVNKHAFGGPDALAALKPFDGKSSIGALDNAFGKYYRKYQGIAPITCSSQTQSYQANDALTVLNYAVNQLKCNFLSWEPIDQFPAQNDGIWSIYDVIRVINAEKGRIITTPPSNLTSGVGGPVPRLPPPDGILLKTQ